MAASIKKKWLTPEFKIIDSNPLQAKNNAAIRESTGHYVTLNTTGGEYKGFAHKNGLYVLRITSGGVPFGNKNDLIS